MIISKLSYYAFCALALATVIPQHHTTFTAAAAATAAVDDMNIAEQQLLLDGEDLSLLNTNNATSDLDAHNDALSGFDRDLQTTGPTKWKTLNYLYSIRGRGTVAGMHERISSRPAQYTEQVAQVSGKYPGLWSGDFLFDDNRRYRQNMIDEAKRRWNAGTMINIMYHSCNPATANTGEECWWDDRTKGPQSSMSNASWQELITDGTNLNRKWKQWLDEIAVYLQDLKNNGVEVLFRPFHEMNQGVFWWGGRPGPSGTLRLYQISHDYLTNVKGLNNLIWVWDVQDFGSLGNDVQNYNPGSNYYEVVALDVYEGFQTWKYDVIRNIAGGKPIAIGECDVLPDASRLASEPLWTFFMSWSELTFSANSQDKIRSVYNSQQAITRDEMGNWKDGTVIPPTPTPPPNPPTGGGGTCGGGNRGNGVCADGTCCSRYGWCGTTADHCSGVPTPTPPTPTRTPTRPPTGGTGGGTCGNGNRGNGVCANGQCCSRYGWCGTTADHCSGVPNPTPPPAPPTTGGTLGDWVRCSRSSQCKNGCCSGTYSNGVLKCTPLNGGFNPSICRAG